MKYTISRLALAVLSVAVFCGGDWPQFRGPENKSVSEETNLPDSLDDEQILAWKTPLPGRGPSSPIVVGNRVIVTASSGGQRDRLHVVCFDASSGKKIWHRRLWATGHTVVHPFGDVAAPTPASDGELIFAFFSSNDLACFDIDGNLMWIRGLAMENPTARNDVGMSSSPLVVGDTVVVQLENQGESFMAGIDKRTGKTRWRHDRQRDASWSSPTVLRGKTPDRDLVLAQSRSKLTAHNVQSGELAWEFETPCSTVSSVTTDGGCVYLPTNGLHRLEANDNGEIEEKWAEKRLSSSNVSPIVHDGEVYTIKSGGVLVCGDANDGSVKWQLRLRGPFWATPVLADGKLYCASHKGLIQVVRLNEREGERGELIGSKDLSENILASPAVADGAIYFRTDGHLWKFAKPKTTAKATAK